MSAHGTDRAWFEQKGRTEKLLTRARSLRAVRRFFDERDFLEVETPLAVPSPGLDLHLDAARVDLVRAPRWLITSPEYQMKRLLSAGFSRIYQVCKCFRQNEEGSQHQPEFTMLEWYRTHAEFPALLAETEELVAFVATDVLGSPRIRFRGHEVDLSPPWERMTVREAFRKYANADADALLADETEFYRVLVERIEPELGRGKPTFLYGYPASQASLARLDPHDPSVAERVEAYVEGVELSNGFGELTNADEQRARLAADDAAREREGKPRYPVDERFLAALESGIPPCVGNALGFDRLVMLLCDAASIEDVVSFSNARL